MVARSAATLITHPFHGRCPPTLGAWGSSARCLLLPLCPSMSPRVPTVITLRCMVQFIGRETKYRYGLGALGALGTRNPGIHPP